MAIIKLANEGDTHTMRVRDCEQVKGQYGEQIKFSDGEDTIFVGLEPATRQLNRCGLAIEEEGTEIVEGETLTFSREPNTTKKGAKPYWSIVLASKADAKPKAESKRIPSPPKEMTAGQRELEEAVPSEDDTPYTDAPDPKAGQANKLAKMYMALWDVVAKHQVEEGKKHGFPVDGGSVNNAAATIWICLDKRNLL